MAFTHLYFQLPPEDGKRVRALREARGSTLERSAEATTSTLLS
jgi:hypothetical protein